MNKILISILPLLIIIFITCQVEDTSDSPLAGWWNLQYSKTVARDGTEVTKNFPEITNNDSNGDGILDLITRRAYMDIYGNGNVIRSQIFFHEEIIYLPSRKIGDNVQHCTDMDSAFTVNNGTFTFSEGGPVGGTATYTIENNSITITTTYSDSSSSISSEELNMIKLGSAPLNPNNTGNQDCGK